ncbi:MAG: class I SAM-dependent methyltransferase [Candidatus Omnitrophica bacterium]|nr:class I SAM-dependent methyltransferase [Candidatus Omnitrophota bacterium]
MQRIRRKLLRAFGVDPHYPDMFKSERERFFAELYLQKIRNHLQEAFGQKRVEILDAGCQAGRLAIPLAKEGHRVTGIDTSSFALKRAKEHCNKEGVAISFLKGDALKLLERENHFFDAILCVEVLYLREAYREFLKVFRKRLRDGGLLMVSHRTKFFYITQALKKKDLESALFVNDHPEGKLWGSYFNWQTTGELRRLYGDVGFSRVTLYPIGTFSEILIEPETLPAEERKKLFQIENRFSDERTGCARYVLACARKDH